MTTCSFEIDHRCKFRAGGVNLIFHVPKLRWHWGRASSVLRLCSPSILCLLLLLALAERHLLCHGSNQCNVFCWDCHSPSPMIPRAAQLRQPLTLLANFPFELLYRKSPISATWKWLQGATGWIEEAVTKWIGPVSRAAPLSCICKRPLLLFCFFLWKLLLIQQSCISSFAILQLLEAGGGGEPPQTDASVPFELTSTKAGESESATSVFFLTSI